MYKYSSTYIHNIMAVSPLFRAQQFDGVIRYIKDGWPAGLGRGRPACLDVAGKLRSATYEKLP